MDCLSFMYITHATTRNYCCHGKWCGGGYVITPFVGLFEVFVCGGGGASGGHVVVLHGSVSVQVVYFVKQ